MQASASETNTSPRAGGDAGAGLCAAKEVRSAQTARDPSCASDSVSLLMIRVERRVNVHASSAHHAHFKSAEEWCQGPDNHGDTEFTEISKAFLRASVSPWCDAKKYQPFDGARRYCLRW